MKNTRPTEVQASVLKKRSNSSTHDHFPALLPAAPALNLPRRSTVKDAALGAIIASKITQAGFDRSWRLAAHIVELVDDSWAVCSEWVALPNWTDPVKRYWIDLQDPATRAAAVAHKKQSGQCGFVMPELAGLLVLTAVAGLLLAGGV